MTTYRDVGDSAPELMTTSENVYVHEPGFEGPAQVHFSAPLVVLYATTFGMMLGTPYGPWKISSRMNTVSEVKAGLPKVLLAGGWMTTSADLVMADASSSKTSTAISERDYAADFRARLSPTRSPLLVHAQCSFGSSQLGLVFFLLNTYNKRETGGVGAEGKPHAGEESVPHRHNCSEAEV